MIMKEGKNKMQDNSSRAENLIFKQVNSNIVHVFLTLPQLRFW